MEGVLGEEMKDFLDQVDVTPRDVSTPSKNKHNRGGLTMYERSKIQMEERERKLKNLQEKLMADYTFAPASSVSSLGSSRAGDVNMVFDRLYHADTAAMRAYRASPRGPPTMNPGFQSPPHRIKSTKDGYITPSRLETMHAEGQNKQRARCMTQKVRMYDGMRLL